jgi:hypothetical protein
MPSMIEIPLFARLRGARNVLIAGAGGGFDVYAGLPIGLALETAGTSVHFANWSFSELTDADMWLAPGLAGVRSDSQGSDDYFPERTLARWLNQRDGRDRPIHAFAPTGVLPLRTHYRRLADRLSLDAVVLVDGGTDILLRGDESSLGTPHEDMTSLASLRGLDEIPTRLLVSIGFGIDAYHGVNHTQVLENIAALTRSGAYLGAFSIPSDADESRAYREAVDHANVTTPRRPSLVNGQIAAALSGAFGDVPLSSRTAGSSLFVNPLMAIYFCFDLDGVAANALYLDAIGETRTIDEVGLAIEAYRDGVQPRPPLAFPH